MSTQSETLHVVAAAVVVDGKVLCCRRNSKVRNSGMWEFPGGKVEVGESPPEALTREMHEELSLEVTFLAKISETSSMVGDQLILLEVHLCQVENLKGIKLTDHDLWKLVSFEDLANLNWSPPDLPAVRNLLQNRTYWLSFVTKQSGVRYPPLSK